MMLLQVCAVEAATSAVLEISRLYLIAQSRKRRICLFVGNIDWYA